LDGFWEEGLKPWDTAAGMIIVKEAGGRLTTYDGRPYSPHEKTLVASNSFIHDVMLETLNA
jgi:myo-inositol-1(or 4)-monophosphatase